MGIIICGKPCINSLYSQGQKATQPFKRTGLQSFNYKPGVGSFSFPFQKLNKEMKKLFVFAMVAMVLTIFNGCQKDELVLQSADAQLQKVVKPDVYVENGYLVFKSQEIFDSTLAVVQKMNDEEFYEWENSLGFVSANTFYLMAEDEFSKIANEEQRKIFIQRNYKNLIINQNEIEIKFFAKSLGDLLNIEGIVKIGKSIYLFTDTKEYVILDGDEGLLIDLKKNSKVEKSAKKNLVIFDPFENTSMLKSTSDFLVGGFVYTDYRWANYYPYEWTPYKRLDYTLERILFTYVHHFDPYTGIVYYSCGYKFFLRLKQYYNDHSIWKSDKTSYWVNNQSLHWDGWIDDQVVQTYNGTLPNTSFGSTSNSVYVYYADQYFITTNPNVSDLTIYSYTSTFRSNRMHGDGCSSCIFWKTITYQDLY